MIYICQQINNERDLFLLKLNEIDLQLSKFNQDYRFVTVENNKTFIGNEKPYYYDSIWKHEPEFQKFNDKIINIKMDGFGEEYNKHIEKKQAITTDFIQKRKVEAVIKTLNPDDIVVICDLDEIPDFREIFKLFNYDLDKNLQGIWSLKIKLFYYYYNCKTTFEDDRVTICKVRDFVGVDYQRGLRDWERQWIHNAGWHFSYIGNTEWIKYKITNFGHCDLVTEEVLQNLDNNIKNLKDIYGRMGCEYRIISIDNSYPEYFINNLSKYRKFIYNDLRK